MLKTFIVVGDAVHKLVNFIESFTETGAVGTGITVTLTASIPYLPHPSVTLQKSAIVVVVPTAGAVKLVVAVVGEENDPPPDEVH